MPTRKRALLQPTEEWSQLELRFAWPEQACYELIRPVVLFGRSPAERALETGISRSTIYRKAGRFDSRGMAGLLEVDPAPSLRALPEVIRRAILELKAEHPEFRPNELATICFVRFGRRPSPHTVKRVLAEGPLPALVVCRYPPYEQIADPTERRLAIVRLHAEGWNIASIAGYLKTTRPTVYATLERWIAEGVQGMTDKPPIPKRPARKADLAAINAIRKLQVNPELGEFRIHAALLRLGIEVSPRTCGRILALNRKLYGIPGPSKQPREPREMPFKADRRHQYWTVETCATSITNSGRATSTASRSWRITAGRSWPAGSPAART